MSEPIIFKNNPKIEFLLLENGFQLIDQQTEQNSGFYSYHDLQSIELSKSWYPALAKWLRAITWIINAGVPLFPDAETCKKAKFIIQVKEMKLGVWLTDSGMVKNVKKLKQLLDKKRNKTKSI